MPGLKSYQIRVRSLTSPSFLAQPHLLANTDALAYLPVSTCFISWEVSLFITHAPFCV